MRELNRLVATVAAGSALALGVSACGGDTTVSVPGIDHEATPADLLLDPAELPAGFRVAELSVPELVEGNQGSFEAADSAEVAPDFCRPSADADFNTVLRPDNAAVLAARSGDAGLVQLVSTQARDLTADRRSSTGRCARNEITLTRGNLAGVRIITEYTTIALPTLAAPDRVTETLVLRSQVTTILTDGSQRSQIGYAGYALIDWPEDDLPPQEDAGDQPDATEQARPGTIQLTIAGATTEAVLPGAGDTGGAEESGTGAPEPTDPSSEAEFATLVATAIDTATAGE